MKTITRAIVSVFDKSGVIDFVKALVNEFGVEILSTGGTGKLLEENGIDYIKISRCFALKIQFLQICVSSENRVVSKSNYNFISN